MRTYTHVLTEDEQTFFTQLFNNQSLVVSISEVERIALLKQKVLGAKPDQEKVSATETVQPAVTSA